MPRKNKEMSMATKCYLLYKKTGKRVDDELRTKKELLAKLNEIMQNAGLDEDAINATYDYQEVSDDGASTETKTDAQPEKPNDEFVSKEAHDSDYNVPNDDREDAAINDDAKGWNAILGQLDSLPPDIASKVKDYKKYLEIKNPDKGVVSLQKNAIHVLYLYNNFLNFDKYCTENFPPALSGFLKQGTAWFSFTQTEHAFDTIKTDMTDIVPQMLDELKNYFEKDSNASVREEFYDEVKDFDEEIQNLLYGIKALDENSAASQSTFSSQSANSDGARKTKLAQSVASDNEDFNQFCKGNPSGKALSDYIMNIAVKKYHLGRIKLNANDPNSTMGWMNPEENESKNVRLSEDINDYLNLKQTKILDEKDQAEVNNIQKQFNSGKMSQKEAQSQINGLVSAARRQVKKAFKIFFDFMGITKQEVMNQFVSGIKRLDETEYKQNWSTLLENYKKTMEKNIDLYKKGHSNDMSAEDVDSCVSELEKLLDNADNMLAAVKQGDDKKLLADVQTICTVIENVKKKTAEAKKAFKGA